MRPSASGRSSLTRSSRNNHRHRHSTVAGAQDGAQIAALDILAEPAALRVLETPARTGKTAAL
jgi:hypothetical protein